MFHITKGHFFQILHCQKICDVGKGEYLSIAYRMELEHRIFYGLRRLDVLEDLLADDTITEIMVNGPDQIFIERNGCLEETSGSRLPTIKWRIHHIRS